VEKSVKLYRRETWSNPFDLSDSSISQVGFVSDTESSNYREDLMQTSLKTVVRKCVGWRDDSVVKGTGCSSREPRFDSQHLHANNCL
jgi:hypothetical protein